MKIAVKRLIRDEKGQTLILTLILIVVGGLIVASLLAYMGTGIISGEVYERKMAELYAADAGVEDAIWKIQNSVPNFYPYVYPEPLIVNDKSVDVTIFREDIDPTQCGEELRYQILSTATSDDGTSTTIDAYLSVGYLDLSNLLDNAIISDTYIGIKKGVYVSGNVTSGGEVECFGGDCDDRVDGTVTEYAELYWPTADDLSAWYLQYVESEPEYGSDTIDLNGVNDEKGPLYRDGTLTIKNSNSVNAILKLTGTLYITGDTKICYNTPNNNEMVLDLNDHTIFVASNSTGSGKEALQIGDKCTIVGSGCIIAVGDVYFAPKGDVGSEDDFVLVMSVNGKTTLQPSGTFYGCMAGDLSVDVKSGQNATIIYTAPEGKGLDVPWGVGGNETPVVTGLSILSWQIE